MNRPPKNMISVTRKSHIPSVEAWNCWPASSNWCATWAVASELCCTLRLLGGDRIRVRLVVDHGRDAEVLGRRRRRCGPLEPGGGPRIGARRRGVPQRPEQVYERDQI